MSLYVDPTTGELKNDGSGSSIPQGQFQANGGTPDASGGGGDDWVRKLAAILGSAAKANQTQNNTVDTKNLQGWNDAENNRLARDKFALSAPGTRAQTSMKASLANNFTPTTIDWGGPGSGRQGKLPVIHSSINHGMENLDPNTKDLNSLVTQDMLAQELKGGATGGGMDAYSTPQPKMGETSTADKLLGAGSTAAALAGLLGKDNNGSQFNIGKMIQDYRDRGLNWSGNHTSDGSGFGGNHTTTISGDTRDGDFAGPIDDPYGDGGDATYDEGAYNWQGPQQGVPPQGDGYDAFGNFIGGFDGGDM